MNCTKLIINLTVHFIFFFFFLFFARFIWVKSFCCEKKKPKQSIIVYIILTITWLFSIDVVYILNISFLWLIFVRLFLYLFPVADKNLLSIFVYTSRIQHRSEMIFDLFFNWFSYSISSQKKRKAMKERKMNARKMIKFKSFWSNMSGNEWLRLSIVCIFILLWFPTSLPFICCLIWNSKYYACLNDRSIETDSNRQQIKQTNRLLNVYISIYFR